MSETAPPPCSSSGPFSLLNSQLLDACIHCGMCLPACPTYLATGRETESPRGRIYLLTLWNQGEQELTPRMTEHIESCLGCLGCQTACPAGVNYEQILNQARPHIAATKSALARFVLRAVFTQLLPNYSWLALMGFLLRIYQASGLAKVLEFLAYPGGEEGSINPLRLSLRRLYAWQSMTPVLRRREKLSATTGDAAGEPVQLFTGCVMDVFYNHVNRACQRLLVLQGRQVQCPEQTCCGALAMHAGEVDITRKLAKSNIAYFESTQGPISVTAAGCGAMLKEYRHLLCHDEQWKERAERFSRRVEDITETLAKGRFPAARPEFCLGTAPPVTVAYHAACHLAHAQGIRSEPVNLLRAAAQATEECSGQTALLLQPLEEAEHCCGSAGIYNLLHSEMSAEVLERKMDFIAQTGATLLVTTNPGCMLQIESGAQKRRLPLKVKHLCELLDQIY